MCLYLCYSCYRCTSSLFNCTWCIKNHLCTHFPVMDCNNNEDFIAGQNVGWYTYSQLNDSVLPVEINLLKTNDNKSMIDCANVKINSTEYVKFGFDRMTEWQSHMTVDLTNVLVLIQVSGRTYWCRQGPIKLSPLSSKI